MSGAIGERIGSLLSGEGSGRAAAEGWGTPARGRSGVTVVVLELVLGTSVASMAELVVISVPIQLC